MEELSRFTYCVPIRNKSLASDSLLRVIEQFERQTGHLVRTVHTDGGGEFRRAMAYLEGQGVKIEITTAYTPQSNGLAERTHSTILSLARICLSQAKLPMEYWSYAVRHVTDFKNNVPHTRTGKVPHQALYESPSRELRQIKPFGCKIFFQPTTKRLTTFDVLSRE